MLLGLIAPLSKALQHGGFPSLCLLGMVHLVALMALLPVVVIRLVMYLKRGEKKPVVLQIVQQELRNPCLYIFLISTIVLNVTVVVASKYTSAVYVQLFIVLSPFVITITCIVVANLHRVLQTRLLKIIQPDYCLFEEEKLNCIGLGTMLVAVLGCVFVVIGGFTQTPETWYSFLFEYRLNFYAFINNSNPMEFIGIALATLACLALSCYLLIIRYSKIRITTYSIPSVIFSSADIMLVLQLLFMSLFVAPSLLFEDWQFWLHLSLLDLCQFFVLCIVVYLFGNLLMIRATHKLGPVVSGSMIPLRLISSILASSIILQDYFKSIYQAIGALFTIVSIALFLILRSRNAVQDESKQNATEHENLALEDVPNEKVIATVETSIQSDTFGDTNISN